MTIRELLKIEPRFTIEQIIDMEVVVNISSKNENERRIFEEIKNPDSIYIDEDNNNLVHFLIDLNYKDIYKRYIKYLTSKKIKNKSKSCKKCKN